jgi:DamX protein
VFRAKIELPAGFEKAPSLMAEALPLEKQTADTAASEDQTARVPVTGPVILTPVEKTTEFASRPPEAAAPRIEEESEMASEPETVSVPEKVSVHETASVTAGIAEKEIIKGKSVYREKWLLSQNASYYTIQILGVHDEGRLVHFIEKDLTATRTNLAYYQTRHNGKDWYPLLYGVYASQKEASSAMQQLPPHIQEASPWIRRLSSVQKAIQKQTKP